MLTRLQVTGFKNLVDVDVRFGPFTCIAGENGVGKSNLFDAIQFLSALADQRLSEAAQSVRDTGGRLTDIRNLFYRAGEETEREMKFCAEMIVPEVGDDDAGQEARASITFLRYSITLVYRLEDVSKSNAVLEIRDEELTHITQGAAKSHLLFPHTLEWRKSAVKGRRGAQHLISTEGEGDDRIIRLHHESQPGAQGGGRPITRKAANLPRTVLSTANAAEHRTSLLARREMQSWRLLQLEPSALRKPDEFIAPKELGSDGSHLAATLYALAHDKTRSGVEDESQVYGQIANRLFELIGDVREVFVIRDEQRELLTLQVTLGDKTSLPARALSDGTLRFLALATLDIDSSASGVICMEEPENGIHPERMRAMVDLLESIACDVNQEIGVDNPFRQVIVNTHSPSLVQLIPDDCLLVAEWKQIKSNGMNRRAVRFSPLPDTWRVSTKAKQDAVSRGKLLAYLNPTVFFEQKEMKNGQNHNGVTASKGIKARDRVKDRDDLQLFFELEGSKK